MEPDTAQQDTQEASQEQEEEEETDPVMLAKKQKQLAKRGVTFQAKVDPKVRHVSRDRFCQIDSIDNAQCPWHQTSIIQPCLPDS